MTRFTTHLSFLIFLIAVSGERTEAQKISGELRQWHKVTLTLDGPEASEDGLVNPFLDYRMQVEFTHTKSGLKHSVPGYFAADGDAANTGASAGNKWRSHLSPEFLGSWTYQVSFRQGKGVAVSDDALAGNAVKEIDGLEGEFKIAATNKTGRDLRGKGRLQYVGGHYLRFAGTGQYFLKAGVDAPENLLAYRDFDGNFKTDGIKDHFVKDWMPHQRDWLKGDPTWAGGERQGFNWCDQLSRRSGIEFVLFSDA